MKTMLRNYFTCICNWKILSNKKDVAPKTRDVVIQPTNNTHKPRETPVEFIKLGIASQDQCAKIFDILFCDLCTENLVCDRKTYCKPSISTRIIINPQDTITIPGNITVTVPNGGDFDLTAHILLEDRSKYKVRE